MIDITFVVFHGVSVQEQHPSARFLRFHIEPNITRVVPHLAYDIVV
jgi:hypothetical protein